MTLSQLKRAGVLASTVLGGVLIANAAAAAEQGPNYTFMEAGYAHVELDDFDADGEALALEGSVALGSMFNLVGSYQDGTIEGPFDIDVDVSTVELGGGMHFPINPKIDFVTQLTWVSTEVDVDGFGGVDDDGYGLGAGLRAMLTPNFELDGSVKYVEINNSDDTSFGAKAIYHFTDMFAMTGSIVAGEDTTTYGVGVRMNLHGM
jgi:Outer membrane protein beta-barrel domain